MEKIKLRVTENQIEVLKRPAVITAGTVGLEAEFAFDSQWDTLSKILVFKAGEKVVATALTGDSCIVPWEVLEHPKQWLRVGVYGANGEGTVVIPTLWAEVAVIHTGADPTGDPATDPTLPIWQEAVALAEQGAAAEQELRAGVDSLAQELNITNESLNLGDMFMELLAYDRYNEYALYDHTDNRENPHDVTCEQIGATTKEELQTAIDSIHIPVRGVDYWTETDQEQIVADVLAALPTYNGEVLIIFTINSQEYQAESGMTWAEWVESKYSTNGFYINEYGGVRSATNMFIKLNGNQVHGNDAIESSAVYEETQSGGSND